MAKLQIYLPEGAQPIHDLPEDKLTIGRLPDNGLQIDHASVSSHHAEIVFEGGTWHLHDLGSTNGTFVNNEPTTDAVLRHGDEVRFGQIDAVFNAEESQAEQPLPTTTTTTTAEAARMSVRPPEFVSSSPLPRNVSTKDPVGLGLMAAAVLGILAFAAAAVLVMQMAAPV